MKPGLQAHVVLKRGALDLDVEFDAGPGEIVALLGPNGAGKTTVLRAVAGLEPLASGRIALDDVALDDPSEGIFVRPEHRSIGYVFQDHLLFPHLSALDNAAFGLRSRGTPRAEARSVAGEWLELLGVGDVAGHRPAALSGGQSQRTALARALAPRPDLLLLDEPLASLDATTRGEVRAQLGSQLDRFQGIRLLVTHDPVDALVLADRLVVMEEGRVTQAGPVAEVAHHPRSTYVADFLGINLYRGEAEPGMVRLEGGGHVVVPTGANYRAGPVYAAIRPSAVALHRVRPDGTPRNVWPGPVVGIDAGIDRIRIRVGGPVPIVAEVTPTAVADLALTLGSQVWAAFKATDVAVYPA